MANEEIIGFHKGSLSTLYKERQELHRIITIVDQLMKGHTEELKKLGVDIAAEAQAAQASPQGLEEQIDDPNRLA